jgi:hypothetical protein
LLKKSVEKRIAKFTHGYRHNTDMDNNKENDTTVSDMDANG